MVSHEFRTPLAVIDGAAQRMIRRKNECTPDELVERAQKIRNAVVRMTELIDSALCASRMDAGKIEFSPQTGELAALVAEVSRRQGEISPDHHISVDVAGLRPAIHADPKLLEQVFSNLLSNAVKYSPDAPGSKSGGGPKAMRPWFPCATTESGIPAGEVPRLFERFFRASTSKGLPGTGIGLDLVKRLVEMHGGSVGVESAEGEGSTFTVRLPIDFRKRAPAEGASAAGGDDLPSGEATAKSA